MKHTISRITTTEQRIIAKDFINKYHSYIKYADRPSRKLYWLIYEDDILIGVFGLGSAFAHPRAVKQFMLVNKLTFNQIANNIVYCLSGHKDKNAGSKSLALCRRDAKLWWMERYGDNLKAFQTFILPPRTGAVYKTDNWIELGQTSGGKSQVTRTLYGKEREEYPEAEIRVFKSGEVKYLLREFKDTVPKIIFMRLS